MTELLELAARCEAAEGPNREIDCLIREYRDPFFNPGLRVMYCGEPTGEHVDHRDGGRFSASPPYTASIDAAMTLLSGAGVLITLSEIKGDGMPLCVIGDPESARLFEAVAATPALALVAASLRARASQ